MDAFRPHPVTVGDGMARPHDKPAKSAGNRHESVKDIRTRTLSIEVMESITVKETTMTRIHVDAQSAQRLVHPLDPFAARDQAHELRSRYLCHLTGVLCAALARVDGRTVGNHQAWQRR